MSVYCYECMKPNLPDGIRSCPACGARIPYEAQNLRDCPPGTVLNGRYLLGKAIGHGGFGVTYIALDLKTGEKVCVKEYNPKSFSHRKPSNMEILLPDEGDEAYENYHKYKQGLLDEGKRLMELRNVQGVVRCYESFECNNTAYVVLEYLEGCDLKQYVLRKGGSRNPPGVVEGVQLTCEVLRILSQVHKHKLLHRDISPDNIFLTDGALKLIDFGSSRKTYVEEMTGFNKIGYAAPEMVNGGKEGPYTDLYSVGGVLYFLLMGEKPTNISGTDRLGPPSPARSTHELTIVYNRATDPQPEARYQSAEVMMQDLMYCLQQFDGAALPSNQTNKNSGGLMRGLLIGTLSVTAAGLIGLIAVAGLQGDKEKQDPVATGYVPVTTYALPSPTVTYTPVPTATPAPQMLQGPKDSYRMLEDTSVDVVLYFSDGSKPDAGMRILTGDSVTIDGTTIRAVKSGRTVVEYTVFGQTRTFTVEVLETPVLAEVSKNTEASYAETRFGMKNSYEVDVPQGDEFVLSLPQLNGVTYTLYCVQGGGELVQLRGNELVITGSAQTQELYTIRMDGLDAVQQPEIQLQVRISRHVLVSNHDEKYTMMAGEARRVPVRLSDGAPVDPQNDIINNGGLDVQTDSADPGVLVFSCNTPGEYNVTVCGTTLYFSVLSEPQLAQMEQLQKTDYGYSITVPVGMKLSLPMEGVNREQTMRYTGGTSATSLSFDREKDVILLSAGKNPGKSRYTIVYAGEPLFDLEITVVSADTVTEMQDEYIIFADSEPLSIPLEYLHGFDADVTVTSSPGSIVETKLDESGRVLTVTPVKGGRTTVRVAGKSFVVRVINDNLTLTRRDGRQLERMDDEYRMEILDTESVTLTINGNHSDYALVCDELGGKLTGNTVTIGDIPSGQRRVYTFRSEGTDDDRVLFTLVVTSGFDMQMETKLGGKSYVLLEGGEVRIPLIFRDGEVFDLNMKYDQSLVKVEQKGNELVITGLKPCQTTVTVEEQSFTVNVAATDVRPMDTASDSIEQTGGNAYMARVTRGQMLTIPLENMPALYQLDCGTHGEDCGVVIAGDNLLISGNTDVKGFRNHEIMAVGTDDGARTLFSVMVEVVEPTATPAPATPTPAPTITPTPAPVYRLVQGPEDSYRIFPGQKVDVPLTFGADGHYALQLQGYDASVVRVSQDQTAMHLEALKVGQTRVSYVSDGQTHSFTVDVLEIPQAKLEAETAYRYMDKNRSGYALSLPVGDEAALLITGADNVALQVVPVQGEAHATVCLDGGRLSVSANSKGACVYSIRPAGSDLELFRVQINVDSRVLTNAPGKEYTLLVGSETGISLTFSDGGPVNLTEVGYDNKVLRISRDNGNQNRLVIKALKSTDGVNISVCGEYFTIRVLEAPTVKTDDVVTRSGSNYDVTLPVGGSYTLTLQNADQRHSYTFEPVGNASGSVKVSADGKSLTVTGGSSVGRSEWDVYDHGTLIFRVRVNAVGAGVTNALSDHTLYAGDTIDVDLEYAHSFSTRPNVSVSNDNVVKPRVSSDGRKLTIEALPGGGTTTVTVGGQSFRVTVLNTDMGINQANGLTKANSGTADYVLTIKDNDESKTLALTGATADHNLSVRASGSCAKVTVKNGQLHVDPVNVGSGTYAIVNTINGEERVLLTLQVEVEFGQEMTSSFGDVTILEGETHVINLRFRNNVVFTVNCSSSNANVVKATVKNGTLTLECRKAGEATITVDGKSFKVTVASRVGLTGTGLTGSNGSYALTLTQGEKGGVRLSGTPSGYRVYAVSAGGDRQELYSNRDWNISADTVGSASYALVAEGDSFSVQIGSLKVTTQASVLTTEFSQSYTIYAGQEYYIPLSASGSMPQVTANSDGGSSALDVSFRNNRLYFTGKKAGTWTVTVTDGTNQRSFEVKVAAVEDVLSASGKPLDRNAQGHYVLTLVPGYDAELELNLPGGLSYKEFKASSALQGACTVSRTGSGLKLAPSRELSDVGQLTIYASHTTGGMTTVNSSFVVATVDVTIQDVWMLSKDRINVQGENTKTVFNEILVALQDLGLWKGRPGKVAGDIAESGRIPDDVWAAMEAARELDSGFSGETYYTREDVHHLKALGTAYKEKKDALHENATRTKDAVKQFRKELAAASGRVNKDTFTIEQAAYGNGRLYLLDADGYLITYNLNTNSTEEVDAVFRYRLLAGNGTGVVAVDENDAISCFGLDADLEGSLESIVTDVSQIAVTDEGVLLVLGPAGRYTISGNKDMPKTTLTEGQALYITGDEVIIAAGMGGKNTVASNVSEVAAGDSVLAFVGGTRAGMQKLYIRYGDTDAPLMGAMGHGKTSQYYVFQNVTRSIANDTSYQNVRCIAVSDEAVAAVWSNGKVFMYGKNDVGQLGIGGGTTGSNFRLVKTSNGTELTCVTQVVLLRDHSLFLDETGRVWISGEYSGGKSDSAVQLSGLYGVKQLIRLDNTRALAINGSGQICIVQNGRVMNSFVTVQNLPAQESTGPALDFDAVMNKAHKKGL